MKISNNIFPLKVYEKILNTGKARTNQNYPILSEYFQNMTTQHEDSFSFYGDKSSGCDKGYIAKGNLDKQLFMMKIIYKLPQKHPEQADPDDFRNFVNEFITASLYKRMLFNRAPLIEAILPSDNALLGLRSKYLNKFVTISEFTRSEYPRVIGQEYKLLKKVEGAEKLFAAIIFGGEYDIHAENIGIMTIYNDDNTEKKVFAKIDHGWSASNFFTKPECMIKNFLISFQKYGYKNVIDINIVEFIKAFEQISEISDKEIEILINSRIQILKKFKLEIEDLNLHSWEDDQFHYYKLSRPKPILIRDFNELESHYVDSYKKQRKAFEELKNMLSDFENKFNYLKESNSNWYDDFENYINNNEESANCDGIDKFLALSKLRLENLKPKVNENLESYKIYIKDKKINNHSEKQKQSFVERLEAKYKSKVNGGTGI